MITRIEDDSYEHVCVELGLEDIIVPNYTMARYLTDMCAGQSSLEVSAMIKGDARVFSFIVTEHDEGPVADLKLPATSRVMFWYRDDKFILPEPGSVLRKDDEVVIITHSKALAELKERWHPPVVEEAEKSA